MRPRAAADSPSTAEWAQLDFPPKLKGTCAFLDPGQEAWSLHDAPPLLPVITQWPAEMAAKINVDLILDPNDVLYDAVDGTVFLNLGSHTHGSLLVRQLSADTHLSQTRCGGGQSLLPEHPLLLSPQTVR